MSKKKYRSTFEEFDKMYEPSSNEIELMMRSFESLGLSQSELKNTIERIQSVDTRALVDSLSLSYFPDNTQETLVEFATLSHNSTIKALTELVTSSNVATAKIIMNLIGERQSPISQLIAGMSSPSPALSQLIAGMLSPSPALSQLIAGMSPYIKEVDTVKELLQNFNFHDLQHDISKIQEDIPYGEFEIHEESIKYAGETYSSEDIQNLIKSELEKFKYNGTNTTIFNNININILQG